MDTHCFTGDHVCSSNVLLKAPLPSSENHQDRLCYPMYCGDSSLVYCCHFMGSIW